MVWPPPKGSRMKPLTAAQKRRKHERDKIHSQRRLAERRCIAPHPVQHRKPARPSAFDKEPMAIGAGDGEEVRAAEARKLLDQKQRQIMKGYWASDSNPKNWSFTP